MTPKRLWIISIFLAGLYVFECLFFAKINVTGGSTAMSFGINMFSDLILVAMLAGALGALIAFIPFKQKHFNVKFKTTFPLVASIMLVLFITFFGYTIYLEKVKGIVLKPLRKYEDIQIPANIDCISVHNGKFETENLTIERNENRQIQTDTKTGEKKEFKVEWTCDCEYVLTSVVDDSDRLNVKITGVTPNSYGCYVISDKNKDKYPKFYEIKRVK